MTRAHRRGARREQEMADALGTPRTKHRPRYQRAPDAAPFRMQNGMVIVPESATRAKLPALLKKKLEQAAGYVPGAVPLVVLSETGGKAIACMPLEALVVLVGLKDPRAGEQLALCASVSMPEQG